VISSSQGLYLHRTTQYRKTNIRALSGIQTRDPVYEQSRTTPQTAQPLDRCHTELATIKFIFDKEDMSETKFFFFFPNTFTAIFSSFIGFGVDLLHTQILLLQS
jgi:hypothetical protein